MIKYYKYNIFKKYNDELWGFLLNSTNFIKLKHKFLLTLQEYLKKNFFYRKRTWFKYQRFQFIKRIRKFNFAFIFYNKRRHWLSRLKLKKFLNLKRKKKFKNFKFLNFLSILWGNLKININFKKLFYNFNNWSNKFLNSYIFLKKTKFLFSSRNTIKLFWKKLYYRKYKFYKIKRRLKKFLHLDVKYEKQFFYSVHIRKPKYIERLPVKIVSDKKKSVKLISLFYGFKKLKKFQWFWSKNKMHNYINYYTIEDFLFSLESRLEVFLFKLNFFNSIYFIKQFIFCKNIFVNNMCIFRPDFLMQKFDIVNINYKYYHWLFKNIKYKLNKFFIFLNVPKYIEIDWGLLSAMLIRKPKILELNKPYKVSNMLFL